MIDFKYRTEIKNKQKYLLAEMRIKAKINLSDHNSFDQSKKILKKEIYNYLYEKLLEDLYTITAQLHADNKVQGCVTGLRTLRTIVHKLELCEYLNEINFNN